MQNDWNERIAPPDEEAMRSARKHWDEIAKPLSSLGKLEDAVTQMAGIWRSAAPRELVPAVCVMCADNGVVAQGVTQAPASVTAAVAANMTRGESTVCVMAASIGVRVQVTDVGMCCEKKIPGVADLRVMNGTNDMTLGPAMTRAQAQAGIEAGIAMAARLHGEGCNLLLTGEMGIGNTTTSSAVAAVRFGKDPAEVTGRGAGLDDAGLARKVAAIRRAIAVNRPDPADALDILAKLGGLDIAGMAGLYIGGAMAGMPVLIDGFISAVAAVLAADLAPRCRAYMMPSHVSAEPAGRMVLDALGFSPMLTCGMCLGEGTGAVAAVPLLRLGMEVYRRMSSFADVNIDQYEHFEEKA